MKTILLLLLAGSANAATGLRAQDFQQASISLGTTTAPTSALTVYGVITSSTPSPTISCSAGTGQMSATATNSQGSFTAGLAATTCTITFSSVTPWPKAPICIVGEGTSLVTTRVSAVSATAFTAAGTTISSDLIYYICLGAP